MMGHPVERTARAACFVVLSLSALATVDCDRDVDLQEQFYFQRFQNNMRKQQLQQQGAQQLAKSVDPIVDQNVMMMNEDVSARQHGGSTSSAFTEGLVLVPIFSAWLIVIWLLSLAMPQAVQIIRDKFNSRARRRRNYRSRSVDAADDDESVSPSVMEMMGFGDFSDDSSYITSITSFVRGSRRSRNRDPRRSTNRSERQRRSKGRHHDEEYGKPRRHSREEDVSQNREDRHARKERHQSSGHNSSKQHRRHDESSPLEKKLTHKSSSHGTHRSSSRRDHHPNHNR